VDTAAYDAARELAELRVLVDVLTARGGDVLRFRCITCERNPDRPPLAQPVEGLDENHSSVAIWDVPEGTYPLELYASTSRTSPEGFIVLPFDLRIWRPHLLHDVRAEWNRAFISSRGVSVQPWEPRQSRSYWLHGVKRGGVR